MLAANNNLSINEKARKLGQRHAKLGFQPCNFPGLPDTYRIGYSEGIDSIKSNEMSEADLNIKRVNELIHSWETGNFDPKDQGELITGLIQYKSTVECENRELVNMINSAIEDLQNDKPKKALSWLTDSMNLFVADHNS